MTAVAAREPRYTVNLVAAVTVGDAPDERAVRVCNLSRRGLCIEGVERAEVDGFVGVDLHVGADGGHVMLFGVVRWVRDGKVGLEIGGMHPRHRTRHNAYLDSLGG